MKKIFNISLHRSGTQSAHDFFVKAGFKSLHWPGKIFDKACADALDDSDAELVWQRYKSIALDVTAFNDIPMPFLYEQAARDFPDSLFLIIRRSSDSWIKSVRRHTANRELDVLEKMQYWKICGERHSRLSSYSDEELCAAYENHIIDAVRVLSGCSIQLGVFELEDMDIASKLRHFLKIKDESVNFGNIDVNRVKDKKRFFRETRSWRNF